MNEGLSIIYVLVCLISLSLAVYLIYCIAKIKENTNDIKNLLLKLTKVSTLETHTDEMNNLTDEKIPLEQKEIIEKIENSNDEHKGLTLPSIIGISAGGIIMVLAIILVIVKIAN